MGVITEMMVLLGAYNIDALVERGREQNDVQQIHVHPDWSTNDPRYDADLAVLGLAKTVTFSIYIRPICLPHDNVPVDSTASIAGN